MLGTIHGWGLCEGQAMVKRLLARAFVLLMTASIAVPAIAEPGDELVGDWERTFGARRTREVWQITRDKQQFAIRGQFLQNGKPVGQFRGDNVRYERATGLLRCKREIELAGKPVQKEAADYAIELKGTRLAIISTLGKRKETLVLTKAKQTADAAKVAAVDAATKTDLPAVPAAMKEQPAGNGSSGSEKPDPRAGVPPLAEVRRFSIGSTAYFFGAALSPDGTRLALSDRTQQGRGVEIHDVDTGDVLKRVEAGGTVGFLAFSDDGASLVADGFNVNQPSHTIAWDTATWSERWRLENGGMIKHAISGDGKWYAAAKGAVPGGPEGKLSIWDLATREAVHSQDYHNSPRLALSADGRLLLFSEGTPAIFERTTRKLIATEAGRGSTNGLRNNVCVFAVTPDGRGYALGDVAGNASVLVTSSGKLIKSFPCLNDQVGRVADLAFLDNRRLLVAHSSSEFTLFDVTSGKALAYLRPDFAGKRRTTDIDIHPGSRRFAAYCGSEAVVYELPE
jgi:WD40 repeat protein